MSKLTSIAIVLAAGSGTRMQSDVPKQYRLLRGMPVLRHSLMRLFEARELVKKTIVVIQPEHEQFYRQAVEGLPQDFLLPPVTGGATRQESVLAGLRALARHQPQRVLVHDAARPFITAVLIANTLQGLEQAKGAICAIKVSDTLKRAANDFIRETVTRENLFAAQTPQAFDYATLLAAHIAAKKEDRHDFTDDAALLEWQKHKVALVEGSTENIKLTANDDFRLAEKSFVTTSRCALGYDVHAYGDGDHVMLGGVKIPHKRGVSAHSDGDVILHALTDAILGLAGNGDIGQHFPPFDPKWKNAPSKIFVAKAVEFLQAGGGCLNHCDVTLIAQEPKISMHRNQIVTSLAAMLGLPVSAVGFKATTSEGMGFIGREEGLAAYVMVTAQF
jgi:2-C-methyl-D-erythritol 4-phosphate cytidylyltransferase/2-C-methyl-D-erythritol 2,4-cyclodiphosphate synthase